MAACMGVQSSPKWAIGRTSNIALASSQALGGHQNAHKKERSAARKAQRAADYRISGLPSPPVIFAQNLGVLGPSFYINAHSGNHGIPPTGHFASQLSDRFGSNGAPRFDNPYRGPPCFGEEDASFFNWQRSYRDRVVSNGEFPSEGPSKKRAQLLGIDEDASGSSGSDQNLDLKDDVVPSVDVVGCFF
ncbi:hypothetical protein EJ110_NYTH54543 [Nymphaea thermarum]|nr:hypothetical protein EJ110_NYTH54543 [Nymphaea thermarum]